MRTLLAKEFRSLLPIILLAISMQVVGTTFVLFSKFPDQMPLSKYFDPEDSVNDLSITAAFMGIVLSLGLLVRESDEGTLTFLDGLPVSRTRVFAAKLMAALAVLTGMLLVDVAIAAVMHALSRDSLDKAFPWRVIGTGLALNEVIGSVCIALGLALSFLRRWLFLVLGVVVWAFIVLGQWRTPHVDLFNPLTLARPVIVHGKWLVPWTHLGVQSVLGLLALAVAWIGFQLTGDRTRRLADRLQQSRVGCLLSTIGVILIPMVWIGVLVHGSYLVSRDGHDDEKPKGEDATTQQTTTHYLFIYRKAKAEAARTLIAEAEGVHDQVAKFLQASPPSGPIIVDTTSILQRHNAGQAYWKKIRMRLRTGDASSENIAVLGHETTHVYLDQLSNDRLADQFPSIRFFHEGLASYVEYRFFHNAEELRTFRRVAAVAHAHAPVKFEQLAKDEELSRKFDRNLAYPLGEIFCAALVASGGDDAPGKVARAFGRKDAPKGLKDVRLWQDTLQACGLNLETVLGEWGSLLDRAVADDQTFIDSIPRLRARVERAGDEIVLRPSYDGTAPGTLVAITRPAADAAEYELDFWTPGSDGAIRIPRSDHDRRTFWYQLGWRVEGITLPLLEPWVEAPVP